MGTARGRRPSSKASRGRQTRDVPSEAEVREVADLVRSQRFLPSTKVKRKGLSAPGLEELKRQLTHAGLEETPRGFRVPVREQVKKKLEGGEVVSLKELAKHVKGAAPDELKAAIHSLEAIHQARQVLHDAEVSVAPMAAPLVGSAQTLAIPDSAQGLNRLAKAYSATRLPITRESFERATAQLRVFGADGGIGAAIRAAIRMGQTQTVDGMVSLPRVVRALCPPADLQDVHRALDAMARRGEAVLEPESGMGRLSLADLALCPRNSAGSPLSWVSLRKE